MTFSIIGIDKKAGELGVACFSKAFAIGGIVPAIDITSGAVATQSYPNVDYKSKGLALMKQRSPEEAIKTMTSEDNEKEIRQIIVMNKKGEGYGFTGRDCVEWAGHFSGRDCIVAGNMLVSERVLSDIKESFEESAGKLAERLVLALDAGQKVGGDKRKEKFGSSALIVEKLNFGVLGIGNRYIDLRVDHSPQAILDLKKLLKVRMSDDSFYTKKFRRPYQK